MAKQGGGSEFVVRLNGLGLSAKATKQIEREIRATTLRELARLDLSRDIVLRFPGGTKGIVADRVLPGGRLPG